MRMANDIYSQISGNKEKTVLLIGVFLVVIIGLGWVISAYYGNSIILYIAVTIALVQAWVGYYHSDTIALAVSRAQPVTGKEGRSAKILLDTVENLSIADGVPSPKVYLINDSAPNAFATGRDPKHASLAVTSGLLEKLDKPELEGVLAHELSHIKNYDIRVMSLVVVLAGIIALVGDLFLRSLWWGGRRSNNDEGGQIMLVVAIIFAILAPLAATLIQLAVSRKREYLADASSALLTRYPEGLANALQKIAADREPLEVANRGTAHLYIANPFDKLRAGPLKAHEGKSSVGWLSNLFSTHPPIEERIKRLKAMES